MPSKAVRAGEEPRLSQVLLPPQVTHVKWRKEVGTQGGEHYPFPWSPGSIWMVRTAEVSQQHLRVLIASCRPRWRGRRVHWGSVICKVLSQPPDFSGRCATQAEVTKSVLVSAKVLLSLSLPLFLFSFWRVGPHLAML